MSATVHKFASQKYWLHNDDNREKNVKTSIRSFDSIRNLQDTKISICKSILLTIDYDFVNSRLNFGVLSLLYEKNCKYRILKIIKWNSSLNKVGLFLIVYFIRYKKWIVKQTGILFKIDQKVNKNV